MNNYDRIKKEWNDIGSHYATSINEMVAVGEAIGWENWKGEEPKDERDHLMNAVYALLQEANANNTVAQFRADFPPAHNPFYPMLQKKGQSLEQLQFIDQQKIVFLVGTAHQKRQAYLLKDDTIITLDESIVAIGKSKQNNVFAIASKNKIVTTQGWEGSIIATFDRVATQNIGLTDLIPFNDGLKVLVVSSDGIFILSNTEEKLIHPEHNEDDLDEEPYLDMENATLSNNNDYIIVGDQCSPHRVLNANGDQVGLIGPQSSYPHYCLFSKDDQQLVTNACHFYNGVTIGVATAALDGIDVPEYEESSLYTVIDSEMRVYAGISTTDYYVFGDAYGYIKAIDKTGKHLWKHFLGSTITGMTISDDEKTLWVGSSSGIVHKLQLNKGVRDTHTIGNSENFEEFRMLFWKEEPILKW